MRIESKSVSIDRYLLRPLGLEIDYLNHRDKREHIYLTFQKPEDRQKLYHKMISQVRLVQIHPVWFIRLKRPLRNGRYILTVNIVI